MCCAAEDCDNLLAAPNCGVVEGHPDNSPSPAPEYDEQGVRTNTRLQRTKRTLTKNRVKTIRKCIALNPHYRPPQDFLANQKFEAKIFESHTELDHGEVESGGLVTPKVKDDAVAAGKWREGDSVAQNLMGVILGPRGNSHKALCASSRSKIELRGKGSQKGGFSTKYTHGEHEEFHVYISAPVSHSAPCAASTNVLGSSQSLSVGWPQDDDCLRRARAGIMRLVKEGLDPNSAHSISINKELHRLNGTVSTRR